MRLHAACAAGHHTGAPLQLPGLEPVPASGKHFCLAEEVQKVKVKGDKVQEIVVSPRSCLLIRGHRRRVVPMVANTAAGGRGSWHCRGDCRFMPGCGCCGACWTVAFSEVQQQLSASVYSCASATVHKRTCTVRAGRKSTLGCCVPQVLPTKGAGPRALYAVLSGKVPASSSGAVAY